MFLRKDLQLQLQHLHAVVVEECTCKPAYVCIYIRESVVSLCSSYVCRNQHTVYHLGYRIISCCCSGYSGRQCSRLTPWNVMLSATSPISVHLTWKYQYPTWMTVWIAISLSSLSPANQIECMLFLLLSVSWMWTLLAHTVPTPAVSLQTLPQDYPVQSVILRPHWKMVINIILRCKAVPWSIQKWGADGVLVKQSSFHCFLFGKKKQILLVKGTVYATQGWGFSRKNISQF